MSTQDLMSRAKETYYRKDFRNIMRTIQGATDEDFKRPVPKLKEMVLSAGEVDPLESLNRILAEIERQWTVTTSLPVNSEWHHFLVPGVFLAVLRNSGYPISDEDITEGMERGESLAGGACGFMGICGGAVSVGVVSSILNRSNPISEQARSESMNAVANALGRIADSGGRCCKRSSYIAFEVLADLMTNIGHSVELGSIQCRYSRMNKHCAGSICSYHPKFER